MVPFCNVLPSFFEYLNIPRYIYLYILYRYMYINTHKQGDIILFQLWEGLSYCTSLCGIEAVLLTGSLLSNKLPVPNTLV